jgi:hypothetical protein
MYTEKSKGRLSTVEFNEILNYALRSQLAYMINQQGWYITEHLKWRAPSTNYLVIKESSKSEINILIEVDHVNKVQWIAVRGSNNLRNWILNLRYMQRPFSKNFLSHRVVIDLHTGFYIAADDVYQHILPHLKPDYQSRLTGHSLGGAIAVILMMFLKEDSYQIEKCITFGQPKITDRRGAEMCQHLPLLRVINHKDAVPLLPPTTIWTQLQGSYYHFGSEITLQHENGYNYKQHQEVLNYSVNSFWARLLQVVAQEQLNNRTESIKDHDLRLYLSSILSNIEFSDSTLEKLQQNLMLQINQNKVELGYT